MPYSVHYIALTFAKNFRLFKAFRPQYKTDHTLLF